MTYIAASMIVFIYIYRFIRKYQVKNSFFLILIAVMSSVSIIIQFVASYLRLDWSCLSITAIVLYVYYDQLLQQIDNVTSLLNRRCLDVAVADMRVPATILFFDVDNFKNINDTFGHTFGDTCLMKMSAEMKRIFKKQGYCYRYGGDEFCVIMTKNIEDVDKYISRFLKNIKEIRETRESHLPYVSIGYAAYKPGDKYEKVVKEADEMMYRYKKKHHEQLDMIYYNQKEGECVCFVR